MAKGQRSKVKRAFRAIRREKAPTWQAEADQKRFDALARDLAADPIPVPQAEQPAVAADADRGRDGAASMAIDKPLPPASSSKKQQKKGGTKVGVKGGLQKRKKQRKVGVLSGFNQFHKKGKKGNR